MRLSSSSRINARAILLVGDTLSLVLWVVVGLRSHQMTDNVLLQVVRVSAPFLIGWFAMAYWTGAYRTDEGRTRFLARSAATWAGAVAIGLLLRATLFGEGFVPTFALVTLIVTAVFTLGWRTAAAWVLRI
jgi:hypothetical protein